MFNVGCDDVEKRHLFHLVVVSCAPTPKWRVVYLPRVRVSREAVQSLSDPNVTVRGNSLGPVRIEELEPLDAIVVPPFGFSCKWDQTVARERHNLSTFVQEEDIFRVLCGIQDWGENGWF